MGAVDFDWDLARAFLATLDTGSLSAAARALGSSQPTMGRRVAALEEQLGAVLFERVGTRLHPTPVARELAIHVRAMEEAAHRVALTAAGRSEELEGLVRISASDVVCAFLLPPVVRVLRRRWPGIELELIATNQSSDLARREADIAIRHYRPTQPGLVARRVRDGTARFYAAPATLERLGHPTTPAELRRAGGTFLCFAPRDVFIRGLSAAGLSLSEAELPVIAESGVVQWSIVRGGEGICTLLEEIGDADPHLVRVLEGQLPVLPVPIWLTCRRELNTTARYRIVFDALVAALARGRLEPELP